jgi:fumarylpyruvate hydrolase
VYGLAVGIDLTRRDVQVNARKSGRPWEIGKAFDHSAPITAITPLDGSSLPSAGAISLAVNGETRQSGDLSEMIWDCAEVVSILSTHYQLYPGDLIYTGTPSGVGPVTLGDRIVGHVDSLPELEITIGE